MNVTERRENLEDVYAKLKKAKSEYHHTSGSAERAKQKYASAKIEGVLLGDVEGKNETEREHAAQGMFELLFTAVRATTARQDRYYLKLQYAQLDVDLQRALLRCDEIELGRLPHEGH